LVFEVLGIGGDYLMPKNILYTVNKLENSIDTIRYLYDMDVSEIDDKINVLYSEKQNRMLECQNKVSIINSEIEHLKEDICVFYITFSMVGDEICGVVYNKKSVPIAKVDLGDINSGLVRYHYNTYLEAMGYEGDSELTLGNYVIERLSYDVGVSVDRLKVYLNGMAYSVQISIL
jgi:FtsZ-binding cell division protein ZapB